ncbi:MAG: hypothetical protein AB7G47_19310 [Mycolicibacterium sp.]|uniref:hypothetical protein n=1 Tax=Mycolicibacterium sp. TaxID=2320850 RepID=UPI003D148FBF
MQLPPQSFPGGPDRGGEHSAEAVYFKIQCNQILTDALTKARVGQLSTMWRAELSPATSPASAYQDLGALAVREIIEMPTAPWEPAGQARDWRDALDSWFSASRSVLTARFTDAMHQHGSLLSLNERSLGHLLAAAVPADFDDPDRASTAWDAIGGEHVQRLDNTRHMTITNYVQARDWLTASYLAGLSAGGLDAPNWREWLRARAADWQGSALAVRRVEIETASVAAHYFDQLPAYWNPSAAE